MADSPSFRFIAILECPMRKSSRTKDCGGGGERGGGRRRKIESYIMPNLDLADLRAESEACGEDCTACHLPSDVALNHCRDTMIEAVRYLPTNSHGATACKTNENMTYQVATGRSAWRCRLSPPRKIRVFGVVDLYVSSA